MKSLLNVPQILSYPKFFSQIILLWYFIETENRSIIKVSRNELYISPLKYSDFVSKFNFLKIWALFGNGRKIAALKTSLHLIKVWCLCIWNQQKNPNLSSFSQSFLLSWLMDISTYHMKIESLGRQIISLLFPSLLHSEMKRLISQI